MYRMRCLDRKIQKRETVCGKKNHVYQLLKIQHYLLFIVTFENHIEEDQAPSVAREDALAFDLPRVQMLYSASLSMQLNGS